MFKMYLSLFPDLYPKQKITAKHEKISSFSAPIFAPNWLHLLHSPWESLLHFIWKCFYHYPQTCTQNIIFLGITWFFHDFSGHHSPWKLNWKFRADIPFIFHKITSNTLPHVHPIRASVKRLRCFFLFLSGTVKTQQAVFNPTELTIYKPCFSAFAYLSRSFHFGFFCMEKTFSSFFLHTFYIKQCSRQLLLSSHVSEIVCGISSWGFLPHSDVDFHGDRFHREILRIFSPDPQ